MVPFPRSLVPRVLVALVLACTSGLAQVGGRAVQLQRPEQLLAARVRALRDHYDLEEAWRMIELTDGTHRVAGNEGYARVIDALQVGLGRAGFVPAEKATVEDWLRVHVFEHELRRPAWSSIRATLTLLGEDGKALEGVSLLQFEHPGDRDRTALAIHSFATPKGGVHVALVRGEDSKRQTLLREAQRPFVIVQAGSPRAAYRRAEVSGAVGAIAHRVPALNQPERFDLAIPFGSIPYDDEGKRFVVSLSRRAWNQLQEQLDARPVLEAHVDIEVRWRRGTYRTLVAEVVGQRDPKRAVALVAHLQEPGANDNASGVAGLYGGALALARAFGKGTLPRPARSLLLTWGDEMDASRRLLERVSVAGGREPRLASALTARQVIAALALDMIGEKLSVTGGKFLIERTPDPAARDTRFPDEHTEWGSGRPPRGSVRGHVLNELVRQCCEAVARREPWDVHENPYEGGSDHSVFLSAGIPALLLWHFTDVFYHTNLDRLDKVDPLEMRRCTAAALAAAHFLTSAQVAELSWLLERVLAAGERRLGWELRNARKALENARSGARERVLREESRLHSAWETWYEEALASGLELAVSGSFGSSGEDLQTRVRALRKRWHEACLAFRKELGLSR